MKNKWISQISEKYHEKRRTRHEARQREEAVAATLTMVARKTEAGFFAVPHFTRTLMAPAKAALTYFQERLEVIPNQVVLDPARWDRDHILNILFNDGQDIADLLEKSRNIGAFFEKENRPEAVALIEADWHQKTIMGVESEGDVIKRDVPQTVFFFDNHSLQDIGATLAEAKERFCFRMLGELISKVAEEIEGLRQWRRELENERDLLKLRLKHVDAVPAGAGRGADGHADARALLIKIEDKLQDLKRQLGTRDDQLNSVVKVLLNPEPHFKVLPVTLHLNRLGIKVRADSSDPTFDITLAKCTFPDKSQKAVLWTHIHR